MFALGVILFELRTNYSIFDQASKSCPNFRLVMESKSDVLMHDFERALGYEMSNEFKDLVTNLVRENPVSRVSITDVIGHPWVVNPDCATPQEIQQEVEQRLNATSQAPLVSQKTEQN